MATMMPPATQDEESERQQAEADALRGIGRARPVKPNSWVQLASLAAGTGKELLNIPGKIPKDLPAWTSGVFPPAYPASKVFGGHGLGDLLFGKSPEALNDWSYGIKKPIDIGSGKNLQTMNIDPRIIDVAGAPLVGAGAALKGLNLGKQVATAAALKGAETVDLGRRAFLQKAGGAAAAGATAAAVPDALKVLGKLIPEEAAAAKVATGAKAAEAATVASKYPELAAYSRSFFSKNHPEYGLHDYVGEFIGDMPKGYEEALNAMLKDPEVLKLLDELTAQYGSVRPELLGDLATSFHRNPKDLPINPVEDAAWQKVRDLTQKWQKEFPEEYAASGQMGWDGRMGRYADEIEAQRAIANREAQKIEDWMMEHPDAVNQFIITGKAPPGAPPGFERHVFYPDYVESAAPESAIFRLNDYLNKSTSKYWQELYR